MDYTNDELLKEIRKRSKEINKTRVVSTAKTLSYEDMFEKLGLKVKCPICDSTSYVRNGQGRYKCKKCSKTFSPVTNTFMDGYKYTYGEWIEIVRHCLLDRPLNQLILNGKPVAKSKVWLLKHKIMSTLLQVPQPKLTGIVQIDETSFRESQKGSRSLESFYAKKHMRIARKRPMASLTGVKGAEWLTIIAVIDESGHCFGKVACLGDCDYQTLIDNIDEMIINPSYICSDGNPIYEQFCDEKAYHHFVYPSTYRRQRALYGYVEQNNKRPKLTREEIKQNKKIERLMYLERSGPHIRNSGRMSFRAYNEIVSKQNLTLNAVNGLHSLLKYHIIDMSKNIGSQYLEEYVNMLIFLQNFKADNHSYNGSDEDTELIIKIMLETPHKETISSLSNKQIDKKLIDEKYNKKSYKKIKEVRNFLSFKYKDFENDDEIVEIFNKRKYFRSLKPYRVNQLCKVFNIPIRQLNKTQKCDELAKLPNADEIIFNDIYLTYYASDDEIEEAAKNNGYYEKVKSKRGRKKKIT